ncbi:MAG: peptidoglycan DD-metalloendopeptidase family protein [Sulfurifustaceae bacterium]
MLPLIGGLAYVLTGNLTPTASLPAPAAADTVDVTDATEVARSPARVALGKTIDFVVQRNDTLERIFRRLRLSLTDLSTILNVPGVRQVFKHLKPGDKLTVVHDDGMVHAINHRISETEVLSVKRADNGFATEIITTPIEIRTAQAHGTISSSFFAAGRSAGLSPETILQLANDIFGWEIDFALDIQPGDRFNLIYEQKYRDGRHIGDGRILAAEFTNDGESHRAIRYTSPDGAIDDYFTPDGRSMHRQFLRAPLDFRRVSSNFNPTRFHPLLNTIRAHNGVDYAAPTGTIVKAAGDGRVIFIGMQGGYGRTVILEHGGKISTLYAHLSGFAKALHVGERVTQGTTIGYVGQSGAATGPHLHYEYRVNGAHMNPRTVALPAATPIPPEYLMDFQSKSLTLLADLGRRETAVATTATRN